MSRRRHADVVRVIVLGAGVAAVVLGAGVLCSAHAQDAVRAGSVHGSVIDGAIVGHHTHDVDAKLADVGDDGLEEVGDTGAVSSG